MELFTNALIITIGIMAGLFVFGVAVNLLRMTLRVAQRAVDNAAKERGRQEYIARTKARRHKLETTAQQMLADNADLADLVADIRNTPYIDGKTPAARINNNNRARLQKRLREMVPNKGLRDVFYGA